nr:hypothetical protein [Tanacetum cinerariifolium]
MLPYPCRGQGPNVISTARALEACYTYYTSSQTSDINKRFVVLEMSIKTVSRIRTPQLEDILELIHHIQSLLPAKEAARTCILSKSWPHAWSTISTLRFTLQFQKFVTDEQKIKYEKVIDHTLQRYHRENISVEILDLELHIQNQESAFAAEK